MQYQTLGKSAIKISKMSLGCWSFGGGSYWGNQEQSDVDAVVSKALELGINCFDTAEMYNNGDSEISLGKALKGIRHKAVIISKIAPSNCKNVRKHLEESLKRLDTDYLDVYMVHWPINPLSLKHFSTDPDVLLFPPTVEDTFAQLDALKKEGLIRSIGISNFGTGQMKEVLSTGVSIDVNELTYNIVSRAIEKEIVPACHEQNISIIGSMALQQGLLSGRYDSLDGIRPHQAHSRHFAQQRGEGTSRHGEEGAETEILKVLETLKSISKETGIPVLELSLAWAMDKPFITSMLTGSRNLSQLMQNIAACERCLPSDIVKTIDDVSLPVLEKLGDNPDYYENRNNSRIY